MKTQIMTREQVQASLAQQKAERAIRTRIIAFIELNPTMTYEAVAEALDCSQSYVCMVMLSLGIERGYSIPGPVGTVFSKWTVISEQVQVQVANPRSGVKWLCRCECGTERWVRAGNLKKARTSNCGCVMKSPAHRQKMREIVRAAWTPERRARQAELMRKLLASR